MRQNANQAKAMTEVALALSMGFFSIMVLAMVSMGSVASKNATTVKTAEAISIQPSSNTTMSRDESPIGHIAVSNQNLIIWFDERFFDHNLNEIDGQNLIATIDKPVLAVPLNLNLKDLIAIQNTLQHKSLKITNLNDAWLSRLGKLNK